MTNMSKAAVKDYEQPFTQYIVCCDATSISGIVNTAYYNSINDTWFPDADSGVLLNKSEAIEYAAHLQNRFSRNKDCIFICKVRLEMKRVAIKLEEV